MSNKKVLYFHIPKTAGTTVANLLDKHFDKTIHHIESESISNEFLNQFDAVSGHVTYSDMDNLLDLSEWTTIATFREPYSYVVSHLCWVRKLADSSEVEVFNSVPKEFQDLALTMKNMDFRNSDEITALIQYLAKTKFFYMHNTQTLYMDNQKRIEHAINNMRQINFIGVMELMDILEFRIQSLFDKEVIVKKSQILNKNPNKYGFDLSDEKTRVALYPLIDKDIVIYEEALRLVKLQA